MKSIVRTALKQVWLIAFFFSCGLLLLFVVIDQKHCCLLNIPGIYNYIYRYRYIYRISIYIFLTNTKHRRRDGLVRGE